MKQTSRDAIRTALTALLMAMQEAPIPEEGQWVYSRSATGWHGAFVQRPGGYALLSPYEHLIEQLGVPMAAVLKVDYPDHMSWIGTPMTAGVLQPRMILGGLLHEALRRYSTLTLSESQIDRLLDDSAAFFDQPTIRMQLLSPVLNVHGPQAVPPIVFPGDVVMRPITDDEFTQFYGGNSIIGGARRIFQFPEFVFVRHIEIRKIVGRNTSTAPDEHFWPAHQELLDRCVLALASFKDGGPVGYDGVRAVALEMAFGAGFGSSYLWGSEHIPVGTYNLAPEEAPSLEAHARAFASMHPSLEMACQRLVDSSRRTKPRDAIIDAVIGLESILLTDVGERQRGENRSRFSTNYAHLFPLAEREEAFGRARDLYDARSLIAHGGQLSGTEKLCGKQMSAHEIATLARSTLRQTIDIFVPNASGPAFIAEGYWRKQSLGLSG